MKAVPHWVAWSGICVGFLLILWGIIPNHQRIPVGPALLFILGIAATVGSVLWYLDMKLRENKSVEKPKSEQIIYQTRAEIYERFMQEKTRRTNIFGESLVVNMRIMGLLGQLKVPSIRNNPAIYQELNQELNKRIEESEKLNKESNKEDEEYNKLIASVQIHFPDSPKLEDLIKATMRPIIITINEPGAMDGEAVLKWYKEQSDLLTEQLINKVQKPLDDLANYLKEHIK